MNIHYTLDSISSTKECTATIGFFDGVHMGHRFLLKELTKIAQSEQRQAFVFTFHEHPRKVLHNHFHPILLNTLKEKLEQLGTTRIDDCVVLNFDSEMAQMSAYDFLKEVLYKQYHVRTLLVGHDHRFGHNRSENFDDYVKYGNEIGIKILEAQKYHTAEFSKISSSEVRNALTEGNINKANKLLSYPYPLRGKVIGGYQLGRKIGFPTANIQPDDNDKLIPGMGVYEVKVKFNGEIHTGMLNIGQRPTIDNGSELSIEVHILNFKQDIYDEFIEVKFIDKIRDEKKFESLSALTEQLTKDRDYIIKKYI